ncbi:aspartyl protease family protein [Pedobacter sp. GSP4]|uniref:aspartyl protease family protein n=1 Tax=Pedobacter sp. GSP4 TaxID=3453716 RepID=UPI003EEDF483
MKTKAILFLGVLFLSLQVRAQHAKGVIESMNQMFAQKSADPVMANLSGSFSIAAYTRPSTDRMLKTIIDRYACDSIQLKDEVKENGMIQLTVIPFNKGKAGKASNIYTDDAYKLLYVDLFDQLYGMNRYKKSVMVAKIPFEVQDGSIILTVKVNASDRPLKLLFDTGADGMAITKTLADSVGIKASRQQNTSVVGGNMQISVSEGNTIKLDTFVLKNQSFALFPEMHKGSDGIIGNSIAKSYITKVDFDKKELSLYSFGDYQYEDQGISVPVTLPAGLFIIPGEVSVTPGQTNTGEFVFDTGASYNLICFRPFVKKNKLLVSGFKPEYNGTTTSMGMSTPTYSGRAAAFSFAKMPKLSNFPITLMAGGGQSENWNPGFDGSIGIRTIGRYNFTINMQKKEIHFVPNHTINFPHDFVLGAYLFGFDQEGKLKLQSVVAPVEDETIKAGQLIESIDGVAAPALLKDSKKMLAVLNAPAGKTFKITYTTNGTKQNISITKK